MVFVEVKLFPGLFQTYMKFIYTRIRITSLVNKKKELDHMAAIPSEG
jgi:hypothetical protein